MNLDPAIQKQFIEAKQVVVSEQMVSASLLQRKLKIGYARAALYLDILEEQGIISAPIPGEGFRRRVLEASSTSPINHP
jgi:DNA segregation ATPase FtsK/SpoIIIE-like protein